MRAYGDIVSVRGHDQLFELTAFRGEFNNHRKCWETVLILKGLMDNFEMEIDDSATIVSNKMTPHDIAEWKIKQLSR